MSYINHHYVKEIRIKRGENDGYTWTDVRLICSGEGRDLEISAHDLVNGKRAPIIGPDDDKLRQERDELLAMLGELVGSFDHYSGAVTIACAKAIALIAKAKGGS